MEEYQLLLQEIQACRACPLCQARMHTVPGDGNLNADIMIIGEGRAPKKINRACPLWALPESYWIKCWIPSA
ncbi:MAG: hypothetical protein ACLUFF_05745 [Acutalibacteraceae bacterium]